MTEQELGEYLALGHELRGVEFKPGGPWSDKDFSALVIRAVLGLANNTGGGYVILGIEEEADGSLSYLGMDAKALKTWKYDDVSSRIGSFADPMVTFRLVHLKKDDCQYLVVEVDEFEHAPILCKKDYVNTNNKQVLRAGACYVRSVHKPETSELARQEDMRHLLELATEKRLQTFVAQAFKAGLLSPPNQQSDDVDPFDKELLPASSKIAETILTRGYWSVRLCPLPYDENRLGPSIGQLKDLLRNATVKIRGWDFPHLDNEAWQNELNSVLNESVWETHRESLRLYRSGQFTDLSGIIYDWIAESSWIDPHQKELYRGKSLLGIADALYTCLEIVKLASNLALAGKPCLTMQITMELGNIQGRQLYQDYDFKTEWNKRASLQILPLTKVIDAQQLLAEPSNVAVQFATEIFDRFGWSPGEKVIAQVLDEVIMKRR